MSGSPTVVGAFPITLTATNSSGTGSANFTLTVGKAAQAAVAVSSAATGTYGVAYTAAATGGTGTGAIVWALGTGSTATGAGVNASSGVVSFTSAGTVVLKAYRATDTNYAQSTTTADFTLTVAKAAQPALTITSATTGTYGVGYTATATGGAGTGAIVWALGTGSTATGAAINATTGAVSFTGPGTVVFNAYRAPTSAYNQSATTANFTLTVVKAPQAATLLIKSGTATTYGAAYTASAGGGSGTGAYFWALGSGSTAGGAAINASTGVVSFTSPGTVVFNVYRAGDANYLQSATTADFTLTVAKATQPSMTIRSATTTSYGAVYTATATGGAGTGALVWALAPNSTASGAAIDASTGAVGFTSPGAVLFTVYRAGDANYNPSATTTNFTLTVGKAGQPAVTIASPTTAIYGTSYTAAATGGVGTGAIAWNFVGGSAAGAAINSSTGAVTFNSAGTVVFNAYRASDSNYNQSPNTANFTLNVAKAAQAAVTISSAATGTYGVAYTATATGGTGTGAIVWALGTGSTATGAGVNASTGVVSFTSAGTVVLKAYRATDTNYAQSTTTADFTLTVAKAAQPALTITSATTGTYGVGYTATATGGAGTGAIVWALGTGSTATGAAINATTGAVSFTGPGTVVFNAYRAATSAYNQSATTANFTLTVAKAPQAATLLIKSGSTTSYGVAYTSTATGGAGTGTLVWALGSGSTAGGTAINASTGAVSFTSPGTVVFNVYRAGDANYLQSATTADFTLTVGKAAQGAMTITSSAAGTYGVAYTATATGGAGTGALVWTLAAGSTATGAAIDAATGVIAFTSPGKVVFNVYRAGDANYNPSATTGSFTLTVGKAAQAAVTISSAATGTYGVAYTATATGGTGTGAIVWALGTGSTATGAGVNASSGVVSFTSAGTVVLKAYRATDTNYAQSATTADFTLTVAKAAQAPVSINSSVTAAYGRAYTAIATGGSGTGAIVWALGTGSTATGAAINASTGAVTFTSTGTVVFNAYRAASANYNQSDLASSFILTVKMPTADPDFGSTPSGTYTQDVEVEIVCSTSGATIRYTTDGSTPSETNGTIYTGVVPIYVTTTLKAIAYANGLADSAVTGGKYTLNLPVAKAPTFIPGPGTYTSSQNVIIQCSGISPSIAYTLDGSTPTASGGTITHGTLYSGPIPVNALTTIKAICYEYDYAPSAVSTGVFSFGPQAAAPIFSPAAGSYPNPQAVAITSNISGALVRYTTDGSTPTETNGTLYTGPVNISKTTRLKAIAYQDGFFADSTVVSGLYSITSAPMATLNVLYDFTPSDNAGVHPYAGLIMGRDGNFYGTTRDGGSANFGTVFKMNPAGVYTTLVSFIKGNGSNPEAELVQGSDGNFYGTTLSGGTYGGGTVFKMSSAGVLTTLVNFQASNGQQPTSRLIQGKDGNFYGTTSAGGSINAYSLGGGTIFKVSSSGVFTTLVYLDMTTSDDPEGSLVQGNDGNFYGVTAYGGDNTRGTFFKVDQAGVFTFLGDSNGTPVGGLVQGGDGNFYGTNSYDYTGDPKIGGVFKISPEGVYTSLVEYSNVSGGHPYGELIEGLNGNFYGLNKGDAGISLSDIFEVTPSGGYTSLVFFDGLNGLTPYYTRLLRGADGKFYGTTSLGGLYNSGVIFQLTVPTVASPVFSVVPDTYTSAQVVALTSATASATIRYTIDGSMPSKTNGAIYSSPVTINATSTLRAIAYAGGLDDSAITIGNYGIGPKAAAPVFTPAPGTYSSVQAVTISTTTAGASIIYTTDGTAPTESGGVIVNGTLYSSPVSIFGAAGQLNAISFGPGYFDSAVTNGVYTNTNPPPSAVVFNSAGGTFIGAKSLAMTNASATNIYYTLDGSVPTVSSLVYTGALSIVNNTVVKAIGVNGGGGGPVASVSFTILPPSPVFDPAPGTYTGVNNLSVTMSDSVAVSIYYTTDGTAPTSASTLYSGPVALPVGSTTIEAIAINANGSSSVTKRQYVFSHGLVVKPVFSLPSGVYPMGQAVTINCPGATAIYYTWDGSVPNRSSSLYNGGIVISASSTIQAYGVNGPDSSPVGSVTYTIMSPVSTPVFNPVAGTYATAQTISITSATAGASIRYTLDGSTPSATVGALYSVPVTVASNTTLNAMAYETGFLDSVVSSAAYVITLPQTTAAPAYTVGGGHTVTIASSTSGASIRYTLDGTVPSQTHGTLYVGPLSISTAITLKAMAYKSSFGDSPVTSVTIGIPTIVITTPANGSTVSH